MPQRSLRGGAAGSKNRIDQRAQRTDRVGSRIAGIAHNHYLDGAKPANVCSEIEVLEYLRNLAFQVLFQISIVNAGNGYFSDLRDVNLARTVHDDPQVGLNLAPNPDLQFVAGADDVVAWNLQPIHGRKCAWRLHE